MSTNKRTCECNGIYGTIRDKITFVQNHEKSNYK